MRVNAHISSRENGPPDVRGATNDNENQETSYANILCSHARCDTGTTSIRTETRWHISEGSVAPRM